jgi:Family of unknown function (DUF5989)
MNDRFDSDFERAARLDVGDGLLREFWQFLGHTKKWWLMPILLVMLLFGLLIFLSGTAAAPFIYSLF